MKKPFCLLLTLAMLCSQATASAESGYLFMKELLGDILEDEGFTELMEEDPSYAGSVTVLVRFLADERNFVIAGCNEEGQFEGVAWTVEPLELLLVTAVLCFDWEVLEEQLDEGYSLIICLQSDGEEAPAVIASAEDARLFSELVLDALEADTE